MTDELPSFATGTFRKRSEFPKDWLVTIKDFQMLPNHFKEGQLKPVFTVTDDESVDWLIDVSKTVVNEVKALLGNEWKGQQVVISQYDKEVDGKKQKHLRFSLP